ncbi:carbohydrate ABC transporter permease [Cohnella fermenti]|uniref:Carbohydrate ABC transporter permease n=1 Tax=Cohnella fermenti TaxID=2565925 RepID=A0A4S4BJB3_9BACL|nr:carbohydrate ABC transporter permease [Cohnella fermenti]THF73746.1 carbohydrate ABC transporter permease [Cohnella fermenti]
MRKSEATGIIGQLELRTPGVRALYMVLFLLMALLAVVCVFPFLWVMVSSLKDIKEFYRMPPTLIPQTFNIEKLGEAWNELRFMQYYSNTLIMTVGSVVFCLALNGLAGYFFSKLKPRGSVFLFTLIVWTMLLPNTVGMVPMFKNIIDFPILHLNLTNTYWPMWLMAGVNPVVILIFKSFFDNIPQSLLEAAKIDGATKLGIFVKVMLPLSVPVIATITIMTVNAVWMDFFWPFMVLKDQSQWTVIVAIYNMKALMPIDQQYITLTFAILPPVVLFLFFQRYIMQGYTFSGIKG